MISLIAIFLFCVCQLVYDYSYMDANTNWSIVYFTTTYLSFALVAFDLICKESSKAIKYTAFSIGLYFCFLIYLELKFINVPFDEYMSEVNNQPVIVTLIIAIVFISIFLSLTAWEKIRFRK